MTKHSINWKKQGSGRAFIANDLMLHLWRFEFFVAIFEY